MTTNQVRDNRVDRLVQSVLAVDPSPEFESRIRQRVRKESLNRRGALRPAVFVSGLAACVAMILVVVVSLQQREPASVASRPLLSSDTETFSSRAEGGALKNGEPDKATNAQESFPHPARLLLMPHPLPRERAAATPTVFTSDPLAQAAASPIRMEPLARPQIEVAPLGTTVRPLTAMVLVSNQNLPEFKIHPFSLLASNEGVAE